MFRVRVPLAQIALCSAAILSGRNMSQCQPASNAKTSGDPLNCANPVCADKMSIFKMATEQLSRGGNASSSAGNGKKSSPQPAATNNNATVTTNSSETTIITQEVQDQCPLDKNELGRATWNLLHTIAAYYPDEPTPEQQSAAIAFVESLAKLYPCPHCAEDFREDIKKNPPR
jgi:hypothetical protein